MEQEIDRMEGLFARRPGFVLPGDNPLSAQIDVTRTVARRCERWLSLVSIRYGADNMAKKYLNRLSDYFISLPAMWMTLRGMDSWPGRINRLLRNTRKKRKEKASWRRCQSRCRSR